ncbi:MAG TPA: GtrA family protein [Candidatus Parcubacteria bacterium]|jgi:putative flippase GtrA|nr:GtrA family protein [Candidatus Parcubacteria bacterium]
MKRIDIIAPLIIGEIVALSGLAILKNLGIEKNILYLVLPIALPILSLLGLWVAFIIGKKFLIFFQASKFVLVGALNTLIDLGVLNLLIFVSGSATGIFFPVFKSIGFIVATINSYFWNKYWTFGKVKKDLGSTEFSKFFITVFIGFLLNVGIASFIVNIIGPQFGQNEKVWANVGAFSAALLAWVWNFFGSKFLVFKK